MAQVTGQNCDSSNPSCIHLTNQPDEIEWIRGGMSAYYPDIKISPIVYNAQLQLYIKSERSRVGLK